MLHHFHKYKVINCAEFFSAKQVQYTIIKKYFFGQLVKKLEPPTSDVPNKPGSLIKATSSLTPAAVKTKRLF